MSDKIVSLRPTPVQHDVVAGLRAIADKLEAEGAEAYGIEAIGTVNLMLGYSNIKPTTDGSGDLEQFCQWELFSWGPRTDPFSVRGLIATVLRGHGG